MPHYEGMPFALLSIESALKSMRPIDELVIVDDGSSTGCFESLESGLPNDQRIRLIRRQVNRGGAWTRNEAVSAGQNDWIFCLDADNLIEAGLLDSLLEAALSRGLDVAVPEQTVFFDSSSSRITHSWRYAERSFTAVDHVNCGYVPSSSGNYLFSRDSWIRAGGYPTWARALDAWGFGLRQVAAGCLMETSPGTRYFHRYGLESYWIRESKQSRLRNYHATALVLECGSAFPDGVLRKVTSRLHRNWFGRVGLRPLWHSRDSIPGRVIRTSRDLEAHQIGLELLNTSLTN